MVVVRPIPMKSKPIWNEGLKNELVANSIIYCSDPIERIKANTQ